jgi:hypothetical protein
MFRRRVLRNALIIEFACRELEPLRIWWRMEWVKPATSFESFMEQEK